MDAPGPVVSFPDAAIVEQIARVEAEQPQSVAGYAWVKGIVWALALALAGGVLYAWVTSATGAQYGIISIAIGIAAGVGAAKGGRSRQAQIVGAAAAAIGYFAGLVMAVAAIVGVNKFTSLPIEVIGTATWAMIKATVSSRDVLFLAIAVYEGWRIPKR